MAYTLNQFAADCRAALLRLGGAGGGLHAECIFEKREPIPDQDDRNANVIEHIDSRYWLQGYSESSCRQGGPKPIAQRGQYALQRVGIRHLRDNHHEGNSAVITPTKMSKSRMTSAIVDSIAVILLVWNSLLKAALYVGRYFAQTRQLTSPGTAIPGQKFDLICHVPLVRSCVNSPCPRPY